MSEETTASEQNWRSAAACRSADPELFFPISAFGKALGRARGHPPPRPARGRVGPPRPSPAPGAPDDLAPPPRPGVRARHVRIGRLSWVRGARTTVRSVKILNLFIRTIDVLPIRHCLLPRSRRRPGPWPAWGQYRSRGPELRAVLGTWPGHARHVVQAAEVLRVAILLVPRRSARAITDASVPPSRRSA